MDEEILHERSAIKEGYGQVFQVIVMRGGLVEFTWIDVDRDGEDINNVVFPPQDAIETARAILKHFNEEL